MYGGQAAPHIASPEDTVVLPGQMPSDTIIMTGKAHEPEVESGPAEEIIDLSAPVDAPSVGAAEPAAPDLDFDLDLGDAAPRAEASIDVAAVDAGPQDGGGIDFDIGGGSAAPAPAEAPASDVAPTPETSMIDFKVPETPDSDYDATATVAMTDSMRHAPPPAEAPTSGGMGLELPGTHAPAMDSALRLPDNVAMLDESAEEDHEKTIVVDFNMPLDGPSDQTSGNGAHDARWQEVATKLDLAKAYEEMGDKDGTRELLTEVMKEGDNTQQDQARTILARLG